MKCPSCGQENRESATFCDACGARLTPPAQEISASANDSNTSDSNSTFIGRQREIDELRAALESALSGQGRLVMLVGEPGIGKTRTVEELAGYAQGCGARVLWGRCYEEQGTPPYWPWVQAIRSYVREQKSEVLKVELGAGAADIAEVVSEVKERLPDLGPPTQLESPEQARFRLFDAITSFLKAVSKRQPLVLVLDDLHWADQPSLLLLQFVTRELVNTRLLLLGTYRDVEVSRRHPLSHALGELTRERLFQRVLLRGWAPEEVGRFIQMMSGFSPPSGLVEHVHRQTEGNPFFVTEVVRLLLQEGTLTHVASPSGRGVTGGRGEGDSWSVRIPEGVREVIGRRLNRLSARCDETLTVASVIGREFTLDQLKPLIDDITEDRLLEVLEESLAARVIEELPHAVGRYQFTHALIQETLTEELTLTRRVRLHARIAEALEELYGEDSEGHAAELAHHFAEAESVLGAEKVVKYSLLAGQRALASYAWEEALNHFRRGLAARGMPMQGLAPARDEEEAALLFGLGKAEADTLERFQVAQATSTMKRAFDYYFQAGDAERAMEVAEYQVPSMPGTGLGNHMIPQALSLVQAESLQAGKLLSTQGEVLGINEGDYEGACQALEHSLTIARREGDHVLEMRTLGFAARVAGMHLHLNESLQRSLEGLALADATDQPRAKVDVAYWAGMVCYFLLGDADTGIRHAEAALMTAEKLGDRYRLGNAIWSNENGYRLKGEWSVARAFSDRCIGIAVSDPRPILTRALLEFETGNFENGTHYLETLKEGMRAAPRLPTWPFATVAVGIPIIARISANPQNFGPAEEAAELLLAKPSTLPIFADLARAGLALISVQQQDTTLAKAQHAAMRSDSGLLVPGIINIDRLLGLLSHTMGNLDQAAQHFEDSLAFCRKAGYRPELAWTCCDCADTLLQRNSPGDRQRAMTLLDECLRITREVAMKPLMERALSRRDILKA